MNEIDFGASSSSVSSTISVAFVAASRAEKYKMTPQATEETPGILRCYDTALFLETIAEAKRNADFAS